MSTPSTELGRAAQTGLVADGRADLAEWERAQSVNFYETDLHLRSVLEFYWGADRLRAHAERLLKFGGEAAMIVDPAVRRANLAENLPRLDRYSATGERTEDVTHSADHHLAGRYIYGSGAMSVYSEPESNLLALALFYLSSYNGEAGHNCPLACTAGVIKTLQHAGGEELKKKYLPRLLDPNYATRFHGAQFLTEIQGGSDVGANACAATLLDSGENKWLINGEKWFCSNVTADLALITARPENSVAGTKGLGLFLLPRRLDDGAPNGIYIRRLKDKLGTKSLATAEVDFKDSIAYQIGEPGRGFQHAMDFVINTSRLYNAVGSAGAARRAYLIAWTYAQRRRAFGSAIKEFPLTQETLAEMRAVTMAITSGSLYLAHLRDEIEAGRADEAGGQFFRLAVNLNKYRSSISATDVIRRGIEILGGNGAMENFSVLPRLLRDSVIFEAWEGAHNTLLAQSVRDIQQRKLHEGACAKLAALFGELELDDLNELRSRGVFLVKSLRESFNTIQSRDAHTASTVIRFAVDRMIYLFYVACLGREAQWEKRQRGATDKLAVIDWLWRNRIIPGSILPEEYLRQIAEVSATL
ncbi:MAG TPA: acyl-CoA dehydrogenase family protein [Blastocatellia bacterium]|jgi:alkylation response protein AidB-like acyl-CoA dehydrogenase|nr:acyl-CoA dehydrogenase family protein [Blastocatellia bacterium]